jgi:formylglycine-generating enzyme required for sulfatase activity
VNRGGSWNNDATNARVANRNNNNPDNRNNNIGFRLACISKQKTDFEQASLSFP